MDILLIFRSADDRDYDKYILAPSGMSIADASTLADSIIAGMKRDYPDVNWEDIEEALVLMEFQALGWVHCEQEV